MGGARFCSPWLDCWAALFASWNGASPGHAVTGGHGARAAGGGRPLPLLSPSSSFSSSSSSSSSSSFSSPLCSPPPSSPPLPTAGKDGVAQSRWEAVAAHRVWDPGGPSTSARVPAWPPSKDFLNFSVGGAQSGEVSVHNSVGGPDWFEDDGSMVFELAEGDVDDHIEMLYRYVLPEDCESDGSDGPLVYNYGHIPSAAGMYTSTPTAPPESGSDAGIDNASRRK